MEIHFDPEVKLVWNAELKTTLSTPPHYHRESLDFEMA